MYMNTATSWISAFRCKACINILETENKGIFIFGVVQRAWKVFIWAALEHHFYLCARMQSLTCMQTSKNRRSKVFVSDSKHSLLQAWTYVCLCTLTSSFICKSKRPSCQCCVVKTLSVRPCSVILVPGCPAQFSAALHWLQSDTPGLRWR